MAQTFAFCNKKQHAHHCMPTNNLNFIAKTLIAMSYPYQIKTVAQYQSDYKNSVENPEALTQLLRTKFASIKSIRTTNTTIVLETVKETSELIF